MRLNRILRVAASAVLAMSVLGACGKEVPESVSVSGSVSESVSNVSEEKEVSASESVTGQEEPAAVEWEYLIKNVTIEELDGAHPTEPAWDGFSDGIDSPFFVAAVDENSDAKLYGVYDNYNEYADGGGVLRIGEKLFRIYDYIDYAWSTRLFSADFDGDGKTEYALVRNDGHGTGFYREAVYIADPEDSDGLTTFNDLEGIYEGGGLYNMIKYEYDKDSSELTYWLEENGTRRSEGVLAIPKEFFDSWEGGATFGELVYGDIFNITFDDEGKLGFLAKGGITGEGFGYPLYDYSVDLRGDLIYKDGTLTYDNLRLESCIAE